MIRLANICDAKDLYTLNEKFNGFTDVSIKYIEKSIQENKQEIVVVAEEDNQLVGFLCVQLKKSFCYNEFITEITELFVDENYRKRKLGSEMIKFAEEYCVNNYSAYNFELLTGDDNFEAQALYSSMGYLGDGEIHLSHILD